MGGRVYSDQDRNSLTDIRFCVPSFEESLSQGLNCAGPIRAGETDSQSYKGHSWLFFVQMSVHITISQMELGGHFALRKPAKKEADPGLSFMSI